MSTADVRREELLVGRELFPDHLVLGPPAVGAGFALKLDSSFRWRLLGARFALSTSAAAANRLVTLDYCDSEGTPWLRYPAPVVQAAGVAGQEYAFARRNVVLSGLAGLPIFAALEPLWLPVAWQIQVNVSAIDVADQLGVVRLYVEKLVSDES